MWVVGLGFRVQGSGFRVEQAWAEATRRACPAEVAAGGGA